MKNLNKFLVINALFCFSLVIAMNPVNEWEKATTESEWQSKYPLHDIIINFDARVARVNSGDISYITLEDLIVSTLQNLNNSYEDKFFEKDDSYNQDPLELAKNLQKQYREKIWQKLSYLQRAKLAGGLLYYNDNVTKAWDRVIKLLEFLKKIKTKEAKIITMQELEKEVEAYRQKKLGKSKQDIEKEEKETIKKLGKKYNLE